MPIGYFTDLSTSCKEMIIDLSSFSPSFLKTDKGISETLAPKSHKAFPKSILPIVQGIEKLPGSLSFYESLF